jgi:hypothetical protein
MIVNNSFDTKQAPFRILFRRQLNAQALMIAEAEAQKNIDHAWTWIQGTDATLPPSPRTKTEH